MLPHYWSLRPIRKIDDTMKQVEDLTKAVLTFSMTYASDLHGACTATHEDSISLYTEGALKADGASTTAHQPE